jgi:tetratricopeptide (TPR) repeat protein
LLTDFGLAKDVESEASMTRSGVTLGTPNYMPPEQAEGNLEAVDERSDVYALGATLYEMIALRPPFEGSNVINVLHKIIFEDPVSPRRAVPDLDRDLETVCMKCLEKDPARRYGSAGELAEELRRYLRGASILARPPTALEKASRWVRRQRTALAAAFAAVLITAGVASALFFAGNRGREDGPAPPAPLSSSPAETVPEEAKREAAKRMEAGKRAIDLAEKAFRMSAEPGVRRGHLLTALEAFEAACRQDPTRAEAFIEKGGVLAMLARTEKALVSFTRAVEINPDLSDAYYGRIQILQDRYLVSWLLLDPEISGRTRIRIESDLAKIEAVGNKPEMALMARGFLHYLHARYAKALKAVREALEADPAFPDALALRATVVLILGKAKSMPPPRDVLESALADYDRALEFSGGETSLRSARVEVLLDLGRRKEAEAEADAVVAEVPDRPTSYFLRAHLKRSRGDEVGARADLDRAEALDFDNPEEHLVAAGLLLRSAILGRWTVRAEDIERALGHLKALFVLDPDRTELKGLRGTAHMLLGRREEAVEDLEAYVEAYPDSRLGPTLRLSLNRLKAGLDLTLDSPYIKYQKANELFNAGEFDEAESYYRDVLKKIEEGNLLETRDRGNRIIYSGAAGHAHFTLARLLARNAARPGTHRAVARVLVRSAFRHLQEAADLNHPHVPVFHKEKALAPVFADAEFNGWYERWRREKGK